MGVWSRKLDIPPETSGECQVEALHIMDIQEVGNFRLGKQE